MIEGTREASNNAKNEGNFKREKEWVIPYSIMEVAAQMDWDVCLQARLRFHPPSQSSGISENILCRGPLFHFQTSFILHLTLVISYSHFVFAYDN